jgi:hypothetical protein
MPLILFGDHVHNSSVVASFVQHVKLFFETKGNKIHLCGGVRVLNCW